MNLFALLDQTAQRLPDRGAVYHGERCCCTWQELRDRALRLAGSIRQHCPAGARIAVVSENRPEIVELLEREVYGRIPEDVPRVRWEVRETREVKAGGKLATQRHIVGSVDNFGELGERPTHPELLDYLADRFVKEGWSVKKMIREVMLTSAYRMA